MWFFFLPVLHQLIFRLRLVSGKLFWTGASCIFIHVPLVFLKAEQSGWGLPLKCSVTTPPSSNLQRTQGTKMLALSGEFVLVPHYLLWKSLWPSVMFWYAHARLYSTCPALRLLPLLLHCLHLITAQVALSPRDQKGPYRNRPWLMELFFSLRKCEEFSEHFPLKSWSLMYFPYHVDGLYFCLHEDYLD